MKTLKRTWADISLDNLEFNYRAIRARLPSGCRFLGVMKADAYGHGAAPVSHALEELGAMGVMHVLCEGGLKLAVSLAEQGLVDEWISVVSPKVIGSRRVKDAVVISEVACLQD